MTRSWRANRLAGNVTGSPYSHGPHPPINVVTGSTITSRIATEVPPVTKWRAMFRQVRQEQSAQTAVEFESWSEADWESGAVDTVLRAQAWLKEEQTERIVRTG
jgi:hypothetical protein